MWSGMATIAVGEGTSSGAPIHHANTMNSVTSYEGGYRAWDDLAQARQLTACRACAFFCV